jgi:hypothetical protein
MVIAAVVTGRVVGTVTGVVCVMPPVVAVVVPNLVVASCRRLLHQSAVVVARVVVGRVVGAVLGDRRRNRGSGQCADHADRSYELPVSLGHEGFSFAGSGPAIRLAVPRSSFQLDLGPTTP